MFVSDVNEAPSFPEAPAWLKGLTVEDLSEPGTRELPKMQVTTAPNIINVDADGFGVNTLLAVRFDYLGKYFSDKLVG